MSASTTIRLTASGACASCNAYGGTQHRPTCRPDVVRRFKRPSFRRARIDARLSAIARTYARQQDALVRSR
jgi:hypothetical protein